MQALEQNPENIKNDDQVINNQEHQYRLAQQVRTLSLPSEMGERFKCIALTKNMDPVLNKPLLGFKDFDQRYRL